MFEVKLEILTHSGPLSKFLKEEIMRNKKLLGDIIIQRKAVKAVFKRM